MNIYRKYEEEMLKYLVSKIPDVPYHTTAEIAAHLANKTGILVADAIEERDGQWKNEIKRRSRESGN